MAIPHSEANPKAYSVGLSVTICHCDEVKNERRSNLKIWTDYLTTLITLAMTGFPLLSLLQSDQKIRTITSHKYVFHLHHNKPIREQL